jgi:hypothetical protein
VGQHLFPEKYRSGIQSLAKGKPVTISGEQPGSLTMEMFDSHHIKLVFIETVSNSKREFPITVSASPNDLIPSRTAGVMGAKALAR